jgi:hypothetical protein
MSITHFVFMVQDGFMFFLGFFAWMDVVLY